MVLDVAGRIRGCHEWYVGAQGRKRVAWLKPEHPYTAINPNSVVHANHNEAHNSAVLRRFSAYRRRTNTYALQVNGLQGSLTVSAFSTQLGQTTLGAGPRNNACNGYGVLPSTREDGEIAHLERVSLYHVLTDQCPQRVGTHLSNQDSQLLRIFLQILAMTNHGSSISRIRKQEPDEF